MQVLVLLLRVGLALLRLYDWLLVSSSFSCSSRLFPEQAFLLMQSCSVMQGTSRLRDVLVDVVKASIAHHVLLMCWLLAACKEGCTSLLVSVIPVTGHFLSQHGSLNLSSYCCQA